MPCSPAKARILLKEKKAVVTRRMSFTIQLTIATGETKQPVTLGVDAGYKHVGLSACTEKAELFASEVELRQERRAIVHRVLTIVCAVNTKAGLLHRSRTASMRIFHVLTPCFEFCLFRKSLLKRRPLIHSF